jgi:hypothetical protein
MFETDLLIDFEDVHDDELRTTYPCPFCEDDFELLDLCCHIDLDHPIEANSGVFHLSHLLLLTIYEYLYAFIIAFVSDEARKLKPGQNISFEQKYQFCTEKSQLCPKLIPKKFNFVLN